MKKSLKYTFCCLAIVLLMKAVDAQEVTYELDPGKTKIEFTVSATMHTVHGTFQLKHGLIHFNPITGEAGGMIVVDVKSGDTGNDGRDRKMHREVLQSERYPEATFKPVRIKGATDLRQNPTAEVEGVLNLHGADHSLTLNIPVRQQGEQLNAETQFVIPYVTWGMKNPSTFILHVSDKVDMKISTSGHITYAGGNGSP